MSTLITADWHLTELAKDRYRFKALEWMLGLLVERNIEQMIILGDLTHNKNYHSDSLTNDVVGFLHQFAKMCPVYILQGNHDYVEADDAFFQFTQFIRNITWIWMPRIISLPNLGMCGFLPHTRDYERDWGDIKRDWFDVALIFAHNSFEGAVGETGKRLSGIPLSVFPDVQVISGDVHAPQTLGKDHQLIYAGSPFTQKFGDDYEPRVLVLDNGIIGSVPVPGPQKRLYDICSVGDLDRSARSYDGDFIKVRYHLQQDERDGWQGIKARVEQFFDNAASVQVVPVLEQKALARVPHRDNKSDHELVKQYGRQQELSPEELVTGFEICDAA